MNSFDLLNKPWISVMVDDRGSVKDVSLLELFKNAQNYKMLAGETPAQDFAILRFLLAIMYTVFTRFNHQGNVYDCLDLNERFIPKEDVDRADSKKYLNELYKTWEGLYLAEQFPEIIATYLNKWSDRFDLYHERYPFYQISDEDSLNFIERDKDKNVFFNSISARGTVYLKTINRRVSESETKKALFSPIGENLKNKLSDSELARWLICFQGYTGTSGKTKLPGVKDISNRGWLYSIGAIYLKQNNLKRTLMSNLILSGLNDERLRNQFLSKQTPVWEKEIKKKLDVSSKMFPINLADLFTNSSIFLNIKREKNNLVFLKSYQTPRFSERFDKKSGIMEPMTIWKENNQGGIETVEPDVHNPKRSFWRSFGSLALKNTTGTFSDLRPTIIQWKNKLTVDNRIKDKKIEIVAVGLERDGKPSNVIVNEIYDTLTIDNEVLLDIKEDDKVQKSGWVKRISDEITKVESTVENSIELFANDISKIRNLSDKNGFIKNVIQEVYFDIDLPFREWLASIKIDDKKEEKIALWRSVFKEILIKKADSLIENSSNRII